MNFRIVPLPADLCDEVRRTRRAPGYGHPAHGEVATGYGPCRSCLAPFEKGVDRRLLFTFDPFRDLEPLPLPGPVFVHEVACPTYERVHEFPAPLRFIPLTLNAYDGGRALREVSYVDPDGDAEDAIVRLLRRPDVRYLHARNTEAGCYMFRIERA